MRILLPAMAWLLATSTLAHPLAAQAGADADREAVEAEADTAARTWLALVDEGRWDAAWEKMSPLLREQVPRADWRRTLDQARAPLEPPVSSRTLLATEHGHPVFGSGALSLSYRVDSGAGAGKIEVLTVYSTDGIWYVGSYGVRDRGRSTAGDRAPPEVRRKETT